MKVDSSCRKLYPRILVVVAVLAIAAAGLVRSAAPSAGAALPDRICFRFTSGGDVDWWVAAPGSDTGSGSCIDAALIGEADPDLWPDVFRAVLTPAPTAETTGVPDGTTLRTLTPQTVPYPSDTLSAGRLLVSTPGAIYDGWRFNDLVEVRAPGVVFRNSLFAGPGRPTSDIGLLSVRNDRPPHSPPPSALVETSSFIPRLAGIRADGVRGSNFTLDRVEITGTVDGVHIFGAPGGNDPDAGNVRITGSWIHDLVHLKDGSHPDGSHNDGIQVVAGRNIVIEGNRFDGAIYNAALMVTQKWGPVADLALRGNILGGGVCTINVYDGGAGIEGLDITGNTFLRGTQAAAGCATTITPPTRKGAVQRANMWAPRVRTPSPAPAAPTPAPTAEGADEEGPGADLPVDYDMRGLPGDVRFVSAEGSDAGPGTLDRPFRTLPKALAASAAGDSVVLRGGTYPVTENEAVLDVPGITVTAYPGEVPVFDGSAQAPGAVRSEGELRWFDYLPKPAQEGDGLALAHLPPASLGTDGAPAGLAAERGWACLRPSGGLAPPSPGVGPGCAGGPSAARLAAGFWPDQAWVGRVPLVQVLDKALVRPGYFYVERTGEPTRPAMGRMYLSRDDAADMSQVRVSFSTGTFLTVAADDVTIQGIRVERHSPSWAGFGLLVRAGADGAVVRDVALDSVSSIPLKVAGGGAADRSRLVRDALFDRVTVERAGWMGMSVNYGEGVLLRDSVIRSVNTDAEFAAAPKAGAVKASRTHRMAVEASAVYDVNGHGIWWDQSSYDSRVEGSVVAGTTGSAVFYEISHGLLLKDNLVRRGGSATSSPTIRLAGASGVELVDNTVEGGAVPVALTADPRSGGYGPQDRPCAEHAQRYGQGTGYPTDCSPGLSSDLDTARPGSLTPGLTWRPSLVRLEGNTFEAGPGPASVCAAGTLVCIRTYSSTTAIPLSEIIASSAVIDGNTYRAPAGGTLLAVDVPPSASGDAAARTPDEIRGVLAALGVPAEAQTAEGASGSRR